MLRHFSPMTQPGIRLLLVAALTGCAAEGPWYDTAPDPDLGYLPLGEVAFDERALAFVDRDGDTVTVDGYLPRVSGAPVAVVLPGAFVAASRYRWVGATLASHGVATAIVQPRGAFATAGDTLGALSALGALDVDLGRVLLVGHSAGGLPQAGLTDPSACPAGFCDPAVDATPVGLRGLALLGYHNQNELADDAPMAAAEVSWLVLSGTRDGLATPDKVAATVDRLQDRPMFSLSVAGMNHYQMTDYVDPAVDRQLAHDLEPDVGNRDARAAAAVYLARFARRVLLDDPGVTDDLGAAGDDRVALDHRPARIAAPTGHGLPRVFAQPVAVDGWADAADVVATTVYRGDRYLLVRDEQAGAGVWRMGEGGAIEPVAFPGRDVHANGLLGAMAVFDDRLWVGLSSGVQGPVLDSVGAQVWAYDGAAWQPVVANAADADEAIAVTGCAADGDRAVVEVAGASWQPGALAGARVDDGALLVLEVEDNTASALHVRRNERAHDDGEVLDCAAVTAAALSVRAGTDENGFGDPWNKMIVAMAVYDGALFVGTGFNYERGASLWRTTDGVTFQRVAGGGELGFHPSGVPITTSISALHVSDHAGAPALYIGGTGTEGYGGRLARYTMPDGFAMVIDALDHDNQQVASMATYRGRLWLASMSFTGFELLSVGADGAVRREMGADAAFGAGWGDSSQLTARLFVRGDELWVADAAFIQTLAELDEKSAYLWRTGDGERWQLVSAHALGVNAVVVSQLFEHEDRLYAVAASGALSARKVFRPVRLYTLTERSLEDER